MFSYFQTRKSDNLRAAFNAISQTEEIEDCESLFSISESKNVEFGSESRWKESSILGISILLITSITVSALIGIWIGYYLGSKNPREIFSPLTEDITIGYETVHFNGSLLKEDVFRQSAGPEVDAAWESLGVNYRSAILPSSRAEASGLLPSHVQVNEKYGGGYFVNVEGLHHLHCLDLLRKTLWYNYDYYHAQGLGPFKNDNNIVRLHTTHCLDAVRQRLMCQPDLAVLGQVWWNKETPQAYPDFNTAHQCRDYERVRKWAEEHQAPERTPGDFLAAPRKEDILESIP